MREVLIRNDVIQVILQGFRDIMSACPLCQTEFDPLQSGQLCPQCRDEVLAKDAYTPQDFRFVGFLAGVLIAAVSSMPGAFLGDLIGRSVGNPLRGCTIGVVVLLPVSLSDPRWFAGLRPQNDRREDFKPIDGNGVINREMV